MSFQEIELDKIDPNPYQTRVEYNEEKLAGIMGTAIDELGIRYIPMVRPHPEKPGRYQLASGWGRYQAMRALQWEKHLFRVENLNDGQMKKEVLVENVNRSDLNEKELHNALEQYREELGIEPGKPGFFSTLSKVTGVPDSTINQNYDVTSMRQKILVHKDFGDDEPTSWLIHSSRGLEDEDRVKLILKAHDRGWSGRTVQTVKAAIKDMTSEVRALVLSEDTKLTQKTIVALSELEDPELMKKAVQWISGVGLGEEMALKYIARVLSGDVREETLYRDEIEETMGEFTSINRTILNWGFNHYMLLGMAKWSEAKTIFDTIEKQMQWLKRDGFLSNVEGDKKGGTLNAEFTVKRDEESE